MITKNNNFFIKSLTKNLADNQYSDVNKVVLSKKPANMYIKLTSKMQEQQQLVYQKNQEQQRMVQIQEQRIKNQQFVLEKENEVILMKQQHNEQQRILEIQRQQQEHQYNEQRRILELQRQQQEHQHNEQQRILQQQQQDRQRIEQQRILQQQQQDRQHTEQQRILQQQQQEHQRTEQQRILQQQQQEHQRNERRQELQKQQQQQENEKIAISQKMMIKAKEHLQIPIFGKNRNPVKRENLITPSVVNNINGAIQNDDKVCSFYSALSDCKTKKIVKNGSIKMDLMNVGDNDAKKTFQSMCLANVNVFSSHLLQNVQLNRENEAILIEFRNLPHVEFIIKNAIIKLGTTFSHTIVCGNGNYLMMKQMCDAISPEIKIIKLEKNNITINEYNNLFYDLSFWEMFHGNKLLFYQEDTIIFKNNIQDFLQYDYVGAPWDFAQNPNFPSVGNGGFSLRNRNMLTGIVRDRGDGNDFNSINKKHISGLILENVPEDIFFSLSLLKLNIGNIPDPHVASYFSTEIIVNKDSLGGHQFWMNDRSWVDRMNTLFQEYRNS